MICKKHITRFMGCEVQKAESNYLIFKTDDMEKPFVSYNENMWSFFEPELKKRLFEMNQDDSLYKRLIHGIVKERNRRNR